MTGILADEAGVRTVADPADIRQSGRSRRVLLTSSEESGPLARHGSPSSASTWPTSHGRCGSDKRDGCSLDVRGCAPRAAPDRRVGPNRVDINIKGVLYGTSVRNLSRIENFSKR